MPKDFISNHGLRMVEAALRDSAIAGLEVKVWDLRRVEMDALVAELLTYNPDVIGFSTFMWSFDMFLHVAARVKRDDPSRLIVLGGPSARPAMFDLLPYRQAAEAVDVLVINEGEVAFRDIVAAEDRSASALKRLPGLALPLLNGWQLTADRPLIDLSTLPSPYKMGLVPAGGMGVLQTYRGCPFTCSFCEWGTLESPTRVRSVDDLSHEFFAMARNNVRGALLVDAGLNLNPHGFRNLMEAAKQTGFFRNRYLVAEVYPAKVKEEHLQFLSGVGHPEVGIGIQSFDNEVLAHVDRAYDEARFEATLQDLQSVATVTLEIILGLPGDTPENFRATFQRARSLRCWLRVYHCVVLPSGLMTRARSEDAICFDPYSLKMESCLGWTREALFSECEYVTREARLQGGGVGQYFWVFPPSKA